MHKFRLASLFLLGFFLLNCVPAGICFAQEKPGCSSSSTAFGRTVDASADKTCSVTSQSEKWTVKLDGKEVRIDKSKLTWGENQSKDVPAGWKHAEISHLHGKISVKLDGVDFIEIKDE